MAQRGEKRNYLRIEAPSFSLELEGEPQFILDSYDNVRQDVLKRLVALMQDSHPEDGIDLSSIDGPIVTGDDTPRDPPAAVPEDGHYVWVYIAHEIYNKVHVVDLDTFNASPLSRFLDGVRLKKIFLDREFRDTLGPLLGTGKTLWSELTKKGRERVAKHR